MKKATDTGILSVLFRAPDKKGRGPFPSSGLRGFVEKVPVPFLVAALILLAVGSDASAQMQPKKRALLVGCTKYPNAPEDCPELYGPLNDIPRLTDLLVRRFGFSRENMVTLMGWPDEEKHRPTYQNIVAQLRKLVDQADEQTQLVLYFSGHGTQEPLPPQVNPLNPKNPEPDGLNEVFLPADFHPWKEGRLTNVLRDDEINDFLVKLRDKGASVWVIFDCCHSGTMSRGEDVERSRTVPMQVLGIPDEAIKQAVDRAQKARKKPNPFAGQFQAIPAPKKGPGNIVALYASQPFESTPELPRPWDAEPIPKNYYGLLTYTLLNVLEESDRALTYRELNQILVNQYRGERGAHGPTPFSEGDLDREVLGVKTWPKRSNIILKRSRGELVVNAGELMGLTKQAILAVHPPINSKCPESDVLGYVQVTKLTPLTANVVPCAFPPKKVGKVNEDDLPELSRCELVVRDWGDMRLKLAVASSDSEKKILHSALEKLDPKVKELVQIVSNPAQAKWVLEVDDDKVFLRPGQGKQNVFSKEEDKMMQLWQKTGQPYPPQRVGGYPVENAELLASYLNHDLPRIFKVENLWRIAGQMAQQEKSFGLKLDIVKINKGQKEPIVNGEVIQPGQEVEIRIHNGGLKNLWVTLLLLDGHFGIDVLESQLESGRSFKPLSYKLKGDTSGLEGIIVLSTPLAVNQPKPEFTFLAQHRL